MLFTAANYTLLTYCPSSQGARHVPYRDSKLTKLLQDSIGGRCETALIATVGPAPVNESESGSTMGFAERCMQVRSRWWVNEKVDWEEVRDANKEMRLSNSNGLLHE